MATGQDVFYPDVIGPRPSIAARGLQRYLNRLMKTANGNQRIARVLFDAFSLNAPMRALAAPAVAIATLRGPTRPPLTQPPFTEHERSRITLPSSHSAGTHDAGE
jgi:hypothetical protein